MIQILRENKDQLILSTQELLMKVNGLEDLEMVMEHRNGQMVPFILDNGTTTEPKEKVNSSILTEMCMKVIG